jgi:hypothetical protein
MRVVGTLLVWAAIILGILVGGNLGTLLKQYLVSGQVDMVFYTTILHGLFFVPVYGLYRVGTWYKTRANRPIVEHRSSGA